MVIFTEIDPLRAFLAEKRSKKKSVGLVPTMGALHEGHLSLLRESKKENDITVCSIYVNPTQFNNQNDLLKYPRNTDRDIDLLKKEFCDVLFIPGDKEIYPIQPTLSFNFGHLDNILEGKYRPGHFNGVAIVVCKLFNIVSPDNAYFGQKDYQQFRIISKLVDDLSFGINLRCISIKREVDGLAMSSRNVRLNESQRTKAVIFYNSLVKAKGLLQNGIDKEEIVLKIRELFEKDSELKLEYFEILDKDLKASKGSDLILLIAGYLGEIRLIDNMFLN
jgi:pantoate--beta-alanine ligase